MPLLSAVIQQCQVYKSKRGYAKATRFLPGDESALSMGRGADGVLLPASGDPTLTTSDTVSAFPSSLRTGTLTESISHV